MSKMVLRVTVPEVAGADELQQVIEQILASSPEIESYQLVSSQGRGLSVTEAVISFVVSVAARLVSTQLEDLIKRKLAKRQQEKASSVEVIEIDE